MGQALNFSLSYEQLLKITEDEIKKCELDGSSEWNAHQWMKADGIVQMWHILALQGLPKDAGFDRVKADLAQLKSLIRQRRGRA
ncbi:hypothetical protein [Serratia marcescens]|uniref:hypothetical protein n=1 Tax=Serratia marcescens TaxID=615 RepID=UPI0027E4DA5D|nr:hypothetical protein [Serratia marcescens]MDH2272334.1 hypothetical protein [Serratia marcescens]MDH2279421.1 hypothetical protein [Serratia marcescens]